MSSEIEDKINELTLEINATKELLTQLHGTSSVSMYSLNSRFYNKSLNKLYHDRKSFIIEQNKQNRELYKLNLNNQTNS